MVGPSAFQILREACDRYGYHCEDVALNGGISIKVSNGQKFFYSGSGQDYAVYPVNLFTLQKMLCSKWITKKMIQEIGEDYIPGQIFRLNEYGKRIIPHLSKACDILPER